MSKSRLIAVCWTIVAVLLVLSLGRFILYMQTPEGQCGLATSTVEHFQPCDLSDSCILSFSQHGKYERALRTQAIYCPIAEKE